MWIQENNTKANPKVVKAEEKRFTILQAGYVNGFLEDCELMMDTQIEHREYHQTMNSEIFNIWIEKQLIPTLNTELELMQNSNKTVYTKWLADRATPFKSTGARNNFGT